MADGPTILALETDSAWVVILVVSLATLPAALLLRRVIGRAGGLASGVLLALPLLLPLLAALIYEHAAIPEIAVLQPALQALDGPATLTRLLRVYDPANHGFVHYALTGSAGPWVLLIGGVFSSVMLLRRVAGTLLVHRLIRRCRPLAPEDAWVVGAVVRLARRAGLKQVPAVLLLPEGVSGAFAVGARRGKILLSFDLLSSLDYDELEGVLAHEIAHLEARDVPLLFTGGLLRDMVAWNPLAHVALRRLTTDRELEADRRAAALTGAPLAVASGLLKLCKLVQTPRKHRYAAAAAFLRPEGRVKKRVSNLLAIADGAVSPLPAGHLPYLLAACLVAVLGLQVGARMAQETGAYAIVLGAPADSVRTWTPPKWTLKTNRVGVPAKRDAKLQDLRRPLRHPDFAAVRARHIDEWVTWIQNVGRRRGLPRATLGWLRQDLHWEAVPLFAERVGPIAIYRLERPAL